jgi:cytoskeletal protein CcmA (bactofilin family)
MMFKKDANEASVTAPRTPLGTAGPPPAPRRGGGTATIGPSISIKGDVTGDEDLLIQGRIEGKVKLAKHNVTIGPDGQVKADIEGRIVVVEGRVEGDLCGQEQIILRHTARVDGSISAPRVTLEDGAVFRGGIEMDAGAKSGKPVVAKRPDSDRKGEEAADAQQAKASSEDKKAGTNLQA